MGTKNNPGKYDCYDKADPDEPIFTLRAKDKHAPTLIWLWATLRELDGEDPEVVKESRDVCVAMLEWMNNNNRKSAGLGQAALGAILELCRAANLNIEHAINEPTDLEIVRKYLATTRFEEKD